MWTILNFKVNEFVHTSFAAAVRCSLQHGIVHIYSPGSLVAAFLQLQPSCVYFVRMIQKRWTLPLAVLWACFFFIPFFVHLFYSMLWSWCVIRIALLSLGYNSSKYTRISPLTWIFSSRALLLLQPFGSVHSVLSLFFISHTPCIQFFLDSLHSRWICQWSLIEQNEMQHVCLWQSTRARFFLSSFFTMRFSMVPLL